MNKFFFDAAVLLRYVVLHVWLWGSVSFAAVCMLCSDHRGVSRQFAHVAYMDRTFC